MHLVPAIQGHASRLVQPASWADVEPALRARARGTTRPGAALPRERAQCMSGGAVSSSIAAPAPAVTPTPPAVPGLKVWLIPWLNNTITAALTGTGDSISAPSGSNQTLTDAGATFSTTNNATNRITIAGASNAQNNVSAWVTSVASTTQLAFRNAAGVAEASFAGTWSLGGYFTQILDQTASLPFAFDLAGNAPRAVSDILTGKIIAAKAGVTSNNSGLLRYADATFAQSFYGGDVCMSARLRSSQANPVLAMRVGTTNGASRVEFNLNATQANCLWQANGGATTTLTVSTTPPVDTWFTAGFRLNFSAATASYYVDGALVGTSGAGVARAPSVGQSVQCWDLSTSTSEVFYAGFAAANATWSDADFLAVHDAFVAYQDAA